MRAFTVVVFGSMVACGDGAVLIIPSDTGEVATTTGTEPGTWSGSGTGTGTATGGGTGTGTGAGDACIQLTSGTYTVSGPAFGPTELQVSLTTDPMACSFTLTDWSTMAGSLPNGGETNPDEVRLQGPDGFWSTCHGQESQPNRVTGVCDGDGSSWGMTRI